MEEKKILQLPEYIRRNKREYLKRRYARDEGFREKERERHREYYKKKKAESQIQKQAEQGMYNWSYSWYHLHDLVGNDNMIKIVEICFPCLSHDVKWIEDRMNAMICVIMSQRKTYAFLTKRRIETCLKCILYQILCDDLKWEIASLERGAKLLGVSAQTLGRTMKDLRQMLSENPVIIEETFRQQQTILRPEELKYNTTKKSENPGFLEKTDLEHKKINENTFKYPHDSKIGSKNCKCEEEEHQDRSNVKYSIVLKTRDHIEKTIHGTIEEIIVALKKFHADC